MTISAFIEASKGFPDTPKFPVLFVGHGSPMNALEDNQFTKGWRTLGTQLPRPNAILMISAHWLTEGTYVYVSENPKTIHDFWGFPKELYDLNYACPGSPQYAAMTERLLTPVSVGSDLEWGIDHGGWVPLLHLFPNADIPVYQMSIDVARSHRAHAELARMLLPLRTKGVLVIASGNIVHNLGRIDFRPDAPTFDWALEFDARAKEFIEAGNIDALIDHEHMGTVARLAVPTPDHFWPLLYALGMKDIDEEVSFPIEGITHGSISMRSVLIGSLQG